MLTRNMMQMIQDLKLRGFAENEIAEQLRKAGEKVPSKPTIRKYYRMDIIPDDPGAHLARKKSTSTPACMQNHPATSRHSGITCGIFVTAKQLPLRQRIHGSMTMSRIHRPESRC